MIFVTAKWGVLFKVRTEFLIIIQTSFDFKALINYCGINKYDASERLLRNEWEKPALRKKTRHCGKWNREAKFLQLYILNTGWGGGGCYLAPSFPKSSP
jgi:hypothetical protein